MRNIDDILQRLQSSAFRRRFHLSPKDLAYLRSKGLDPVMHHAANFIAQRLAPANPVNDGKQTPYRGHPVFVAQHATATCCRSCLAKWHQIPAGRPLEEAERTYVLAVIKRWLQCELGADA